jgi:hypothetical protein
MRFFLAFFLLLFPLTTYASVETHYAARVSARRGSETIRFAAAARFVHQHIYRGGGCYECSVRKLLPEGRGAAFLQLAATEVARITRKPVKNSLIALTAKLPAQKPSVLPRPVLRPMTVDAKGRIVSGNPVWNACVHGLPLTAALMRTNPDVIVHRQRRVRVIRPMSCRDYHRGDIRVWMFADDPSIELVLDKKGRLLGDPPAGYTLQKLNKN